MTWVALALLGLGLRTAAALSVGFVPAGEATRDASPPALTYRAATHDSDFDSIGMLRLEVFSPHLRQPANKYKQSCMFADAAREKLCVMLALKPGEQLVGCADLALVQVEGAPAYGYASNVCVDPAARRMGIGAQLMAETEVQAIEHGTASLVLHVDEDNVAARGLYEHLGFEYAGSNGDGSALSGALATFADDEAEVPQLLMTKPVGPPVAMSPPLPSPDASAVAVSSPPPPPPDASPEAYCEAKMDMLRNDLREGAMTEDETYRVAMADPVFVDWLRWSGFPGL